MTRRMSVSLTLDAVRARQKTVTRRHPDTWPNLRAGDPLALIEKGMGLPKGARQVVVCEVEIVSNRVEPLGLVDRAELVAEGFPDADPLEWRRWWAKSHGYPVPVNPALEYDIECRRIEWLYLPCEHLSTALGL